MVLCVVTVCRYLRSLAPVASALQLQPNTVTGGIIDVTDYGRVMPAVGSAAAGAGAPAAPVA
jgi:hypothetical protein